MFQTNTLFKTNKCHHGGPPWSGGPGAIAPVAPPLNSALSGIASRETIRFNSVIVNDFKVLTSHSHEVSSRFKKQLHVEPESAFDAPFLPTHSSHLCYHERARWGRLSRLCPRARETPGTPLTVTPKTKAW